MAIADVDQIAWVVTDIEAAVGKWVKTTGAGPFFIFPDVQVDRVLHRGLPADYRFTTALGQWGTVQVELVQQHDNSRSIYRDVYSPDEGGFHHACRKVADYEGEKLRLSSLGVELATEGMFGDMRFAYFDARSMVGHVIELLEDVPSINALFEHVRKASLNWDGERALRPFDAYDVSPTAGRRYPAPLS